MPLPRDYSSALFGASGLGHGQPTMAGYGELKRVSARDIDCPEPGCPARSTAPCEGPGTTVRGKRGPISVLHPSRIELAKRLRDTGELAVTVVEPPSRCRKCSTFSGRSIACSEHSCQRSNCNVLAVPGTSWCADHRDAGNGRQKMTPGKIEELRRMKAEGLTHGQVAARLGVSVQTVFNYVKAEKRKSLESHSAALEASGT
jgi:hypothetical protein